MRRERFSDRLGDPAGASACTAAQTAGSPDRLVSQAQPTFSDALARVRWQIWRHDYTGNYTKLTERADNRQI